MQARRREIHWRRKEPDAELPVIQCDYTFWQKGQEGWNTTKYRHDRRATPSLTAVCSRTGYIAGCVVLKKGVWEYAMIVLIGMNEKLAYDEVILRGDAESSLQLFLNSVAARVQVQSRQKVQVQLTAPGQHQSIGLAENTHARIGGQIRVMAAVLKKLDIEVEPMAVLFPWLLRHAIFLLNRFSTSSAGTTPYYVAFGRQYKESLVQFGEAVHAKTMEGGAGNKLIPRWYVAILGWNTHPIFIACGFDTKRDYDHEVDQNSCRREHVEQGVSFPGQGCTMGKT